MNQHTPPNDLASDSFGEGHVPEGNRTLPDDSREHFAHTVNATGKFVAWLAIGFSLTLVGSLIGLVLYIRFELEGDERMWGGAVLMVGVWHSLLAAAGWAIVPPIAALVDRKLALGAVLLGFLVGFCIFFVIW